ncbi:uncharacterized protein A4U43_C01F15920 [Asparagus officinalis]|uniref:Uncharacterized protein n=1 Tax=Asparagus officinalis TaxID=4686 RepID=A0A5P1FRE1_ASPOF|nr:glutenin, high molecular weight subunit DX5-like [Asparagus officinalis]ONK80283.1 uncharacterized protein A4U43_C01F15920 [Asparagus officinalis]
MLPEQDPGLSGLPVAAPVVRANQPTGRQQKPSAGVQPGEGDQGQEQEEPPPVSPVNAPDVNVNQPIGQQQQPSAGAQPVGVDEEEEQGKAPAASPVTAPAVGANRQIGQQQEQASGGGVQPGAGVQGQQSLGFGAQPLVDNTPFDSGSSRVFFGFGYVYALASFWFNLV